MAEKLFKIAVVGAGGMGRVHIRNYAHIEGCKVVAVCDPTEAGAAIGNEFGASVYRDIDEMLASTDVDVVDVCTPTFLHKAHVMAALGAKKHVICEKPIALCAKDAEAMFALAKQNGVRLFATIVRWGDCVPSHRRKRVNTILALAGMPPILSLWLSAWLSPRTASMSLP